MTESELAFLRELQTACLKETEDYLNSFRECLAELKERTPECIQSLQKIIHSMKGNFQAAAFLSFGEFVHELETTLEKCNQLLIARGAGTPESDVQVLEFFLSNVLASMETYLDDLRKSGQDAPSLLERHREPLTMLGTWKPSEEASQAAAPSAEIYIPPEVENFVYEAPPVEKTVEKAKPTPAASVLPTNQVAKPGVSPEIAPTAPVPTTATAPSASGLFLLFQNTHQYFAIAIEHVVEVIKTQPLSCPPTRRRDLCGLLNLRGEVLPIMHIPSILSNEVKVPTYVVVAKVDDIRFGFQVDAVHQVIQLDQEKFQAVNALASISEGKAVTRFFQAEDKTISILAVQELAIA